MLGKLGEFDFGHVHESVDFIFGALEIFDTEGVDSHDFDAGLIADFKYLAYPAAGC